MRAGCRLRARTSGPIMPPARRGTTPGLPRRSYLAGLASPDLPRWKGPDSGTCATVMTPDSDLAHPTKFTSQDILGDGTRFRAFPPPDRFHRCQKVLTLD